MAEDSLQITNPLDSLNVQTALDAVDFSADEDFRNRTDLSNLISNYLDTVQDLKSAEISDLETISKIVKLESDLSNTGVNKNLSILDGINHDQDKGETVPFDNTLSNIDWDAVSTMHNFPSTNPLTNQVWANTDELYDFFNRVGTINGTSLDPAEVIGHESHWKRWMNDNTGSKYPRIVGSDYLNFQNYMQGNQQDNPYFHLTSAYVAGRVNSNTEYDNFSFWYTNLEANIVQNMFRFDISKFTGAEYKEFFGEKNGIQPDFFHPLANVGDDDELDNGLTPSVFMLGYYENKYDLLNEITQDQKGHYVATGANKRIFIEQPENWNSITNTYQLGMNVNIKLMMENDGLTQADFIGMFGENHSYMNIFNGDVNSEGINSLKTNMSGNSFYSQESEIPGFINIYSSGNSMLAMGINFDPHANNIQSIRFAGDHPVPGSYLNNKNGGALNFFGDRGNGQHYEPLQRMVSSYMYDRDLLTDDTFMGGYRQRIGNLDTDWREGVGFTTGEGKLGVASYLGFDHMIQGYLRSHDFKSFDPSIDIGNYFGGGSNSYPKYTTHRGRRIHSDLSQKIQSQALKDADGGWIGGGLPDFGKFLLYNNQGWDGLKESSSAAESNGKLRFMTMLKYALENPNKESYHIQKIFEDLNSGYAAIGNTTNLFDIKTDLEQIQALFQTKGGFEFRMDKPSSISQEAWDMMESLKKFNQP